MTKNIVLALLVLASIGNSFAGDRQPVDKKTLDLVRSNNKLEEFRVYISKKVKIKRQSSSGTTDNIGADISRETMKKIQKESLSNDVRGKIIAITQDERFPEKLIYVSFDKSCVEKYCSYVFSITDGTAKLFFVPSYGMDQITVKSKHKVFYHKWNVIENQLERHLFLMAGNNSNASNRPELEFKLSENESTVRDEIRNRGW